MIGVKVELQLSNTLAEDVLLIIEDQIKNSKMKSQARQFEVDSYADGITRTVTTHDDLNNPRRDNNKIMIQGRTFQEIFPGKQDLTGAEIPYFPVTYDALAFTVFQVQRDVLLKLEYSEQWQDMTTAILSELRELFPDTHTSLASADPSVAQPAKFNETPYKLNLNCTYKDFIGWIIDKFPNAILEEKGNTFEISLPDEKFIKWAKQIYQSNKLEDVVVFWSSFIRFEVLNHEPLNLEGVHYWFPKKKSPDEIQDFIALANNYFGKVEKVQVRAAKPETGQEEYEIVGRIDANSVTLGDVAETIKRVVEWHGMGKPISDNQADTVTPRHKEAIPQNTTPEKPKQRRGAQGRTENSLKRLRQIRLDAIKNHRQIPTKAAAMDDAGITDKTWKSHDKELWDKWDDKSYKQEKQE